VGETFYVNVKAVVPSALSVSSNGSTWVKPDADACRLVASACTFSILERIDVGETNNEGVNSNLFYSFQYPRTDRRG